MKFSEMVDQAVEFLRRRERVSYRALQREFDLDDESLADLKVELIDAQRIAVDEDGKVLVWIGATPVSSSESRGRLGFFAQDLLRDRFAFHLLAQERDDAGQD